MAPQLYWALREFVMLFTHTDGTKRGFHFHSLWGWGQMIATSAYFILIHFSVSRRRVAITVKADFHSVCATAFPSLHILLPTSLLMLQNRFFLHVSVTEPLFPGLMDISFSTCICAGKNKRRPGYISCSFFGLKPSQEYSCTWFRDRILQDILDNSPLCATPIMGSIFVLEMHWTS